MVYLDHCGDRLLYRNGSQVSLESLLFYKSPRLVHSNGTACFRSQRLLKRGDRTAISILIR